MNNLGRPTIKAGPDYGEWHYPPELPDGYIVASRDRKGWLVRVRAGGNPEQRVVVGAEEVPGRDTLRSAAAVGLIKALGGSMRRNPDEEAVEADAKFSKLATLKTARKAHQRVGMLRRLFGGGAKVAASAGAKAGAKTAAKVGAKTAAKSGAKAVPGVGEVLMVLDAAPEAIRVEKEKYQAVREMKRRMSEAKGAKATAAEFGKGIGEYATITAGGVLRVGAAAIVGSDTVNTAVKSIRSNPSAKSNYAEIAQMLRNMPSDWNRQYRNGRAKLGVALPDVPKPEQAMMLIGITAGGNRSGDLPYGPNPVPDAVREEAMHGLRLSHKNNYGAWDFIGVARAIELAISDGVSDTTMKRMRNYFTRHAKDRLGKNWGNAARPSRGWMAWLNWGGDAGYNWVNGMKANPYGFLTELCAEPPRSEPPPVYIVRHPKRGGIVLAVRSPHVEVYKGTDPAAALAAGEKARADGYQPYLLVDGCKAYMSDLRHWMKNRELENPYHKEGRDQWGKVCFYIYNDDGSQVVGPTGPRFCYKVEKAEEMVKKAEAAGKRVSPSPVSPGPRPTPAPAAAPTGYVRQRIQEQAAKPITHSFKVGDIIDGHYWSLDYVHFYVVRSVAPSSVVVQQVDKTLVGGNPWDGMYVPNVSAPYGDAFRIMLDANGNLKGGESMVYKKWSGQPLRQTSNMD